MGLMGFCILIEVLTVEPYNTYRAKELQGGVVTEKYAQSHSPDATKIREEHNQYCPEMNSDK